MTGGPIATVRDSSSAENLPVPIRLQTLVRAETTGPLAVLTSASADARVAARARLEWLRAGAPVPEGVLPPQADLLDKISEAPNEGQADVWAHLPDTSGPLSFTALRSPARIIPRGQGTRTTTDGRSWRRSIEEGGVAVGRITLDHPALADLADDLSCAWEAHVEVVAVLGRVPSGSSLLGDINRMIVLSYEGLAQVEVSSPLGTEVQSAPAGTVLDATGVTALQIEDQGLAIVFLITMPTRRDVVLHAGREAGYWPSFRAGLPSEPGVAVEISGHPGPLLPAEYLDPGFRDLIGPVGFAGAMAWWRSALLPAPRRARPFLEPEPAMVLRADLPGGMGTLIGEPDQRGHHIAATAGWLFELPDPSLSAACALVRGESLTAEVLKDHGLLSRLLPLDVLRIDPDRP